MRRAFTYGVFVIVAFLLPGMSLRAQRDTIRKEVKVVKPYEPTLSGARKLTVTPVIRDTSQYRPEITYSFHPHPMMTPFRPRPIKPARLQPESVPRLYKSYLKLGMGSHVTPLAEFYMSSLRSRDHLAGVYVKSLSSYGNVKLSNGKKVDGNYSILRTKVFGKKMFRYTTVEGDLHFNNDKRLFYGYYPSLDTLLNKDNIRQNYLNPGISLGVHSTHADSNHVNYSAVVSYDYLLDRYDHYQHSVDMRAYLYKVFQGKTIGLQGEVKYFKSDLYPVGNYNANITFEPWFYQSTSEWRLKASLAATFDLTEGNTDIRLYPRIRFQFKIIPEYLVSFVGMDGGMNVNDRMSLIRQNPYLKPDLYVRNTDRKMVFFVGLSGSIAPGTEYKLYGSFSLIDQMPFYVNDTASGSLGNQFIVLYDDVQRLHLSGEFIGRLSESFSLYLRGAYDNYSMTVLEEPWHKAPFNASLGLGYNLQKKILVKADLAYVGARYAQDPFTHDRILLKGYPDLNLSFEYRYRKILSFFLNLNNIASVRYEPWNQYPSQGFFVMGGFTYSL